MQIQKIQYLPSDIEYSYRFAKSMETYRTHPTLGYRTAGSVAEIATGLLIEQEMCKIGLKKVKRDLIHLDGWSFEKAKLSYQDENGWHHCELGGYQTEFNTEGPQTFSVIYLKKGIAQDYKNQSVQGKLVLIDINQRDEWWINYPVYQAYLKGAAAVLAVQSGGYGEVNSNALNAQDIAGPKEAAAFSISQKDALPIKKLCQDRGELSVILDAKSCVSPNTQSYNIVGEIPGTDSKQAILFTAHYDSYFSGFQDDNAAIGMMLGIAKKMIQSGIKPQKTWRFCAMAAEEWGVINSKYDWSTGAYEALFSVHPEWRGQVIVDFNFELPAYAHGPKDYIRCIYEYRTFIKKQLKALAPDSKCYPKGIGVISPIVTWSDDFSMAIGGIPSMVNDFSQGHFMETHYHSQFDNESVYHEDVYTYHHTLYTHLALAFDQIIIVPLHFKPLFKTMLRTLPLVETFNNERSFLQSQLETACNISDRLYKQIQSINTSRQIKSKKSYTTLNQRLLKLFYKLQTELVKLNWHDEVQFPHQIVADNLFYIQKAQDALNQNDLKATLKALYHIDNNRYAFLFDEEVYDYFTQYAVKQPRSRLKWGYGRLMPHENLYTLVQMLKEENKNQEPKLKKIQHELEQVKKRQTNRLEKTLQKEIQLMTKVIKILQHLMMQAQNMMNSN